MLNVRKEGISGHPDKQFVATDPVIVQGEMVAEYHKFYGSAGLMMLNEIHSKIQKKPPG